MKRLSWIASLLVIASLALAACAPANNNGAQATATVADDLPVATEPVVDATATLPAVATDAPTATVEATEAVTPAVDVTATVETTGTVEAGEGVTDEMVALDHPYLLSRLVDSDLQSLDGEAVGDIERIFVDDSGALRYVEVETEGFLDIDGKNVLLPWGALDPMVVDADVISDDELVVNIPAETLAAAPEFVYDENLDFTAADWDADQVAYWGGQNLSIPATGAEGGQVHVFDGELDDVNAVNTQGEDIGEVEDFVVDPAQGRILYAVLEVGGFLGIGERQVPVPFASLALNQDNAFVVNIDQETLDTAPFVEDWDVVDFRTPDFAAEWDAFWANITTPVE